MQLVELVNPLVDAMRHDASEQPYQYARYASGPRRCSRQEAMTEKMLAAAWAWSPSYLEVRG
jgi:hypothetical protein